MTVTKICSDCRKRKPLSAYYKRCMGLDGRHYYCKVCYLKRHRVWKRTYMLKSPRFGLDRALRAAVKRKPCSRPVTLDQLMDLWNKQKGRCALSGIKMSWGRMKIWDPTTVSIDRIRHDGVYTLGNVRLVCYAVNAFRMRMSDNAMLNMAKAIVEYNA